mmetsp:Transcript_77245/g.174747  ORF Transcript_77245/g.174747 Transcript_77245/m.174747 type:complete len:195 (-) Transcript_77245:105-689(-)
MRLDCPILEPSPHGGRWQDVTAVPLLHSAMSGAASPFASAGATAARPTAFVMGALKGMMGGGAGGGAMGAAAGAGLGGKAMYHFCSGKCVTPAACMPVKQCLDSCANKAFLAGAAAGGMASMAGHHAQKRFAGGAGPLDEWTAGPVIGVWNRLEVETPGEHHKFFCSPRRTTRSQGGQGRPPGCHHWVESRDFL